MGLRVGRIPYVNCYPVYGAVDRGIVTLAGEKVKTEKTCPGIYKIEKDTLTLAFREPHRDVERPTEFATKKGDQVILLVLKKKGG